MPVIPIQRKEQLRPRDVVQDPVARATGEVVSLAPMGAWQDGSGDERICVQWRWSGHRSDPRISELRQVIVCCRACGERIIPDTLIHDRYAHDRAGDHDHEPRP